MLADLKTAQKVTGAKQVTRALKNGTARRVFLAQDADPRVTEPIAALCRSRGLKPSPWTPWLPWAAPAASPWQRCGRHPGRLSLIFAA